MGRSRTARIAVAGPFDGAFHFRFHGVDGRHGPIRNDVPVQAPGEKMFRLVGHGWRRLSIIPYLEMESRDD